MLPAEELATMKTEDGDILVTCEFCSAAYRFDESEIEALVRRGRKAPSSVAGDSGCASNRESPHRAG